MAGISVELRPGDLKRVQDSINFFRFGLRRDIEKITDEIGLLVESTAKELAPVDTGRLRSSIHYDKPSGTVGTNVTYAPYLEFKNHPFLFPAAERWRQAYIDKCREAILSRG